MSKLGNSGEFPTIEVVRYRNGVIFQEELIDWSRVSIDPETGEKTIHEEPQI